MVKISILYPYSEESPFDMEYYLRTHMPMAIGWLSRHPGYRGVSVERGIAAPPSGMTPAYAAICNFLFASADDFVAAFMPHATDLQADIPRYTSVTPIVQFSVVEIAEER